MDEQRFNMSMRKFLKEVGVTSQQATVWPTALLGYGYDVLHRMAVAEGDTVVRGVPITSHRLPDVIAQPMW